MIRRGSNVGQSKRNVCRFTMRDQFDRNQALIVVRRYDDIEFTAVSAIVQAVRRIWSANGDTFGRAFLNCRSEDLRILVSKHPAFAGVWIDRGNCDPLLA